MRQEGVVAPAGSLAGVIKRANGTVDEHPWSLSTVPARELSFEETLKYGAPQKGLSEFVNRYRRSNLRNLWRGARRVFTARALNIATVYGQLSGVIIRSDGETIDLGLLSMRVVTTTGVGYLVDALQNIVEPEALKYHGLGTGTTAEAVGDTALVTELTTQYNPDNTRATGSLTEGASGNIFRTVGTNNFDAAAAVTEHGILTQAATGGGVLLDRSVFSVLNFGSGDSFQTTYDFTIAAGG